MIEQGQPRQELRKDAIGLWSIIWSYALNPLNRWFVGSKV
jgi:hypothetical protein